MLDQKDIAKIAQSVVTMLGDRYSGGPAFEKLIYPESEAAVWFGVNVEKLRAWRRRGIIDFIQYPEGRVAKTATAKLGDAFAYDIGTMLDFAEKYLQKKQGSKRYYLRQFVPAEIDRQLRAA